jgi:hypothetical protein
MIPRPFVDDPQLNANSISRRKSAASTRNLRVRSRGTLAGLLRRPASRSVSWRIWFRVLVVWLSAHCGTSGISDAQEDQTRTPDQQERAALDRFLTRFDDITRRGFVKTLRTGDTGVGFTLESLLEIPENNSPRADFHGMDLKAYRIDGRPADEHAKLNLFLKEPRWLDGLTGAERIRRRGYVDDNGRPAWYLSVTHAVNESGLSLSVAPDRTILRLQHHETTIGEWSAEILQQRLDEKLNHVVFVGAESRGAGDSEEFYYRDVTWCRRPDAGRLLDLVDAGDIIVELRMHLRPDGTVRNHGTAFRVRGRQLATLFATTEQLRPRAGAAASIRPAGECP